MLKQIRRKAIQRYEQFTQKYEIQGVAGEGAYGLVKRAVERSNPSHAVAVKSFKPKIFRSGEGIPVTVCREINLLRELSHENIIHVRDVVLHPAGTPEPVSSSHSPGYHHQHQQHQHQQHREMTSDTVIVVFDYCRLDLERMLKRHKEEAKVTSERNRPVQLPPTMEPCVVKSIMWQVLRGIAYLHRNSVLHRDLKPSNILINSDGITPGPRSMHRDGDDEDDDGEEGMVKIGDFGLARVFTEPLRRLGDDGPVVTIWYRAPELLLGSRHYTPAIDMWSVGCIFGELLLNRPLFEGKEVERTEGNMNPFQHHQLDRIFGILGTPTVDEWPTLSKMAEFPKLEAMRRYTHNNLARHVGIDPNSPEYDLLSRMLTYDPMKRITAEEALQHEYFKMEPLPTKDIFAGRKVKYRYPDHSGSHRQHPQQQQQHPQQQQQQYRTQHAHHHHYHRQQQQQQRHHQQYRPQPVGRHQSSSSSSSSSQYPGPRRDYQQHPHHRGHSSSSTTANAPFALSGSLQQQQQHSRGGSYSQAPQQQRQYQQQAISRQNQRGQKRGGYPPSSSQMYNMHDQRPSKRPKQ